MSLHSETSHLQLPVDIGQLKSRYDELTSQLTASGLDTNKRHRIQKELSFITTALNHARKIEELTQQRHELELQKKATTDQEFAELIEQELITIADQIAQTMQSLDLLLYPPHEIDKRSAFIEIRAGTGGQEAALFAGDLLRMYTLYVAKRGWKSSLISESTTDLGGFREGVLEVHGKGAYGALKHESGVHRVQRVPATETQGRIHTSTATVAVFPEAEDVEISIAPQDLRIDVYRASGAGGQHVNTTDSAVRITHIPTGVVVACQDERSQHKNKAKALKILQSRLLVSMQEKQEAEMSSKRKEMIGGGARSEKVRTYNFPQNRVTDHQVDLTLKNLDMVMEGALDPIIDALAERDAVERRKHPRLF